MITSVLLQIGFVLAVVTTYVIAFVFGYRAAAGRIRSMEEIEQGSRKEPFTESPMDADWQLSADEVEDVEDWEEFDDDVDDDSVF